MQAILQYIRAYIKNINWRIFVPALFFMALGVFINYYFHLQNTIRALPAAHQYLSWYLIFLAAFAFGYGLQAAVNKTGWFKIRPFVILLLLAPALFAWKMVSKIHISFSSNQLMNAYWNHVIYWPYKLLVFLIVLLITWRLFHKEQPFYGFSTRHFHAKPYFIMLLMMVPLVAVASTRPDFLLTYPKLKNISFLEHHSWYHTVIYELAYGFDFFSIELFFRGFLVLAFAKWAGKDAILPMALFYCTIHFGKPLGECISSFFGGLILGIVTYHTKTIWGGLMVHLGIAWLMELGGYLGNHYLNP